MKKKIFSLLLLSLLLRSAPAQNISIDTLEHFLASSNLPDSQKVDTLNSHCWRMIAVDISVAKKLSTAAQELALKIGYKKGYGRAIVLLSNIYYNMGDYENCLKLNIEALKIREESGDEHGAAGIYGNIGAIYQEMNRNEKALESYEKSLQKFRNLYSARPNKDDEFSIAVGLSMLAGLKIILGKYPDAIAELQEAMKIFKKQNTFQELASCMNDLGVAYSKSGKGKEAFNEHINALKICEGLNEYACQATANFYIAKIYFADGDLNNAIKHCRESIRIAQIISLKKLIKDGDEFLSELFEKTGNYKLAYEKHKLFSQEKDSMINNESIRQITDMQTKYETEKNEKEIILLNKDKEIQATKLNKQKSISYAIGIGLALVLLFSVVVFRQRNRISKEKNRSDELLLNILPEEVAEELKTKGRAEAKHFDSVTVMFTDFKGFTQISEKLSPTELVAEIDFCFKVFDNIITKNNIEKIKTIGDSYMCAGGLPVANKSHAGDVVKAALEIQKFMQQHLHQRKTDGKEIFEIRIGVHTGPVVAGIVGSKKFAYDIWGDTVNTASRMESSGEVGQVNISESTYELVKWDFKCEHRGKINTKGKGEVNMYFVETLS